MNIGWLQQVQKDNMIGQRVRIMKCTHVDVHSGQEGTITGHMPGGYAVEVTCKFAIDMHGFIKVTKTETVFAEANHVEVINENKIQNTSEER